MNLLMKQNLRVRQTAPAAGAAMFFRDPYVLPVASGLLIVATEGVLHGIVYPHL